MDFTKKKIFLDNQNAVTQKSQIITQFDLYAWQVKGNPLHPKILSWNVTTPASKVFEFGVRLKSAVTDKKNPKLDAFAEKAE